MGAFPVPSNGPIRLCSRQSLAASAVALVLLAGLSCAAAMVYTHRHGLAGVILDVVQWVEARKGPKAMVVLCFGAFLTSFPPMLGYGLVLLTAGYVFGWQGFLPVYTGALAGASVCFTLGRVLLRPHIQAWVEHSHPNVRAIDRAIQEGGFGVLLLVRICPYPFGLFNLLLSLTVAKTRHFVAATAVSLFKQLIHISIGASVKSMTELLMEGPGKTWELAFLAVAVAASLGFLMWMSHTVRKMVERNPCSPHSGTCRSDGSTSELCSCGDEELGMSVEGVVLAAVAADGRQKRNPALLM